MTFLPALLSAPGVTDRCRARDGWDQSFPPVLPPCCPPILPCISQLTDRKLLARTRAEQHRQNCIWPSQVDSELVLSVGRGHLSPPDTTTFTHSSPCSASHVGSAVGSRLEPGGRRQTAGICQTFYTHQQPFFLPSGLSRAPQSQEYWDLPSGKLSFLFALLFPFPSPHLWNVSFPLPVFGGPGIKPRAFILSYIHGPCYLFLKILTRSLGHETKLSRLGWNCDHPLSAS